MVVLNKLLKSNNQQQKIKQTRKRKTPKTSDSS